jgi:hypothetical protein
LSSSKACSAARSSNNRGRCIDCRSLGDFQNAERKGKIGFVL